MTAFCAQATPTGSGLRFMLPSQLPWMLLDCREDSTAPLAYGHSSKVSRVTKTNGRPKPPVSPNSESKFPHSRFLLHQLEQLRPRYVIGTLPRRRHPVHTLNPAQLQAWPNCEGLANV